MNGWALPDEVIRAAPAHAPRPRELGDLELLLSGALAPLTGFPTRADLAAIARTGRLADGTPWPVQLSLEVPAPIVAGLDPLDPLRRVLVLTDPEGAPLAAVDVADVWPTGEGVVGVGGAVRRIGERPHGTFPVLRLTPEEARETLPAGSRVLGVFADRPLHRPQLAQIAYAARTIAGHVLVLIPVGEPGPDGLPPEALVRTVLAARDRMPHATLVATPRASRGDHTAPARRRARCAAN
jgi:sulfate adenylyltransferase